MYAIGVSPDGHSVAILSKDFHVMIYDKIKEKTFSIVPITIDLLSENTVTIESLLNLDSDPRNSLQDRFSIFVSNNCSSIFVMSDTERLVAIWT